MLQREKNIYSFGNFQLKIKERNNRVNIIRKFDLLNFS